MSELTKSQTPEAAALSDLYSKAQMATAVSADGITTNAFVREAKSLGYEDVQIQSFLDETKGARRVLETNQDADVRNMAAQGMLNSFDRLMEAMAEKAAASQVRVPGNLGLSQSDKLALNQAAFTAHVADSLHQAFKNDTGGALSAYPQKKIDAFRNMSTQEIRNTLAENVRGMDILNSIEIRNNAFDGVTPGSGAELNRETFRASLIAAAYRQSAVLPLVSVTTMDSPNMRIPTFNMDVEAQRIPTTSKQPTAANGSLAAPVNAITGDVELSTTSAAIPFVINELLERDIAPLSIVTAVSEAMIRGMANSLSAAMIHGDTTATGASSLDNPATDANRWYRKASQNYGELSMSVAFDGLRRHAATNGHEVSAGGADLATSAGYFTFIQALAQAQTRLGSFDGNDMEATLRERPVLLLDRATHLRLLANPVSSTVDSFQGTADLQNLLYNIMAGMNIVSTSTIRAKIGGVRGRFDNAGRYSSSGNFTLANMFIPARWIFGVLTDNEIRTEYRPLGYQWVVQSFSRVDFKPMDPVTTNGDGTTAVTIYNIPA